MPDAMPKPSATGRGTTDKRAAILDAALELFVELGFHGTAVPLLAKRAGVGAGTIYRYFENKEALVNVLYGEWKEKLATHLLSGFSPGGEPKAQFMGLWRRMSDFAAQYPTAYAFIEIHHHAAYLDAAAHEVEQRYLQMAVMYIQNAQAEGKYRDGPPEVLWSLVEGAFIGLARFSRGGRLELTPEVIEFSGNAAWELVRRR